MSELFTALVNAPDAFLALIGAVFGGGGLKLIEHWLGRSKNRDTLASDLRKELREDMASLRQEVISLREEVIKWKDRYYKEAEENAGLNARLSMMEYKQTRTTEVVQEKHGGLDDVLDLPTQPS